MYLGIDQHRKQLTVCVRDEQGDVILRRQVSTEWKRARAFLAEIRKTGGTDGFIVILEVCGFNDWLVKLLDEHGCRETILVQPDKRSKKKTDRRDANALCEILWLNRERMPDGKPVQGIRRVVWPTERDAENRQLTALRMRLGQLRTRTVNKIKHLLRKHNLEQECPTKGLATIAARKWLAKLALGPVDRLGSITKQGSAIARFILGQMVLHVLRRDPAMKAWYGRIKKRRGSKIARVAVMRRLATIIWQMVTRNEPYRLGGRPRRPLPPEAA